MVTIYSPQIDAMSDDTIQYRAALAYRATPGSEPVFGAGWFESRVVIDTNKRIVHPTDLKVTDTRFPAGTDDIQPQLASVLAQQSPDWNLDFSMDELDTALKTAASETAAVNTAPPKVIYRDHPALLISIDGEPVLREIENSTMKAVINTPYPLIFDGKYYYLNAAKDVWYRARKATGPYQFESTPPVQIAAMVNPDDDESTQEQSFEAITAANAPEIVVATEPAELIVTEGPAAFVPLVDDLLVLQNSDDDVFMHVSSQNFYIVLAGRWYRASSLTGPWVYQAADSLPQAFAKIPRDSNQADSRVYVAGTEEAHDAVMDAQVPQTAAVERGEVDIEVRYDGEPVYRPVDGADDLVYIQNTGSTVLVSGGLYYLVEEGVWYVSHSPNGPWQVSDHRPRQVATILPTSPVYNTKYVYVYDSTPSVVYVGYTPGYVGSYVYRNTIFYGTGWYYRPWVSPYYYYPRFTTWGLNVSYNPWGGWDFGLSWGWGPFSVAYYPGGYWHHNHHWYYPRYSRWGPGRYRSRPAYHGHDRYAHHGGHRDRHDRYDGHHDGDRYDNSRDRGGNSRPRANERNYNLYRDGSQRARVASTRDKQSRIPGSYAGASRQVKGIKTSNGRVQGYAGKSKAERNRTGLVSSSELRTKARMRDVNLEARSNTLVADKQGNVYRKPNQKTDKYARPGGKGGYERSTTMASAQPAKARTTANGGKRQAPPTYSAPARQPQQKTVSSRQRASVSGGKQKSAPAYSVSARQPQQKTVNSRQRTTASANTPDLRSQAGKQPLSKTRQRSYSESNAPARLSQSKSSANATKQRSRSAVNTQARQTQRLKSRNVTSTQPARVASSRVQKQTSSANAPRSKSSAGGGARYSAPAIKAPQKNTAKSSHQSSGAKSSGAKSKSNAGGKSRDR